MAQTLDNLDININVDVRGLPEITTAQRRISSLGSQVNRTTAAVRNNASAYNANAVATNKWAKGALQQAGFQVGDFAVQIANGTSGIQAFGQQGSQLLGIFGPIGAVLGAGVAIASAIGVAYEKSSTKAASFADALEQLDQSLSLYRSAAELAVMSSDDLAAKYGVAADRARELFAAQEGLRRLEAVDSLARSVVALRDEFGDFGDVSREELETAQQAFQDLGEDINRAFKLTDEQLVSAQNANRIYTESVRDLQAVLGSTTDDAFNLAKELTDLATAEGPDAIAQELDDVRNTFNQIVGGIGNATEEQRELLRQLIESSIAALNLNAEIIELDPLISDAEESSSGLANELERAAQAVMNINTSAFQKLEQLQAELRGRTRGLTDEQIRIQQAAVRAEQAAREAGVDSAAELATIAARAAEAEREIIKAEQALEQFGTNAPSNTRPVIEGLTDAEERAQSLANSMQASFERGFMSIVEGNASVKDSFKAMARDVIAELYRIYVVKRIVGSLDISGGKGSGLIGKIFGGFLAQGGAVSANRSYIVGEKGPEMLVPSTSGRVIPNNQLGGGGQTVVVNQTINVSTGVQQTVRAEIKQLMPQIADSAKQAVVDAKRRGGSYGRAFA